MLTARDLLRTKGGDVWSVPPGASVHEAVRLMAGKGVGAVLVREGDAVVGILSERDCARKLILDERPARGTPVREIMTARVVYVQPEETVEECMALMTDKRVRHLPVMEGGRLLGLLSIGDLVKSIIAEQKFAIQQLEHYVSGPPHP